MRSFALNEIGDLIFPMRFVEGIDEVIQLCISKILTIFDEDVFELETGVDWFGIMLNVQSPDAHRVLEIRTAILSIPEVTDIIRLDVSKPDSQEGVIIRFQLNTIFGETAEVNA